MSEKKIHFLHLRPESRGSYVVWTWDCACGETQSGPLTVSRTTCQLDYWSAHLYPELDLLAPVHEMTTTEGEFGGPDWVCSCGVRSNRPEGYSNDRRARQAHASHTSSRLRRWWRAQHEARQSRLFDAMTPAERDEHKRLLRWAAKDSVTQTRQTAHLLSELI